MSKAIVRDEVWRYKIWGKVRGNCDKCFKRTDIVLVRAFAPVKVDFRICHSCLLSHLLWVSKAGKSIIAARNRIRENKEKLAKLAEQAKGNAKASTKPSTHSTLETIEKDLGKNRPIKGKYY